MNEIATYEDKVTYIDVVAQRGAEARRQVEQAGQRAGRRRARQVFRAMGVFKKPAEGNINPLLVLSDTPPDRSHGELSTAWAKHVRRVFVSSFVAGTPRPAPPRG